MGVVPFHPEDMLKMRSLNLEFGRCVLSAAVRVPEEAVLGELGWKSFENVCVETKLQF